MSRDADVIVIGAGIIGAACAHDLAQAGLNVRVLDDRRAGATAAGMGHLVVMDDSPAELALSQFSLQRWHEWAPDLNEDCAWSPRGTLWIAANEAEMIAAQDKQRTLQDHGLACHLITPSQLHAMEPSLRSGLAGALHVPGDSAVYAPNAARWLLNRYPNHIQVQHDPVIAIEGGRVQLGNRQWLQASAVVLANGIHATQLCPELPISPKKGQLLITERYSGQVQHQLVELGYITSAHHSTGPSVAFNLQPRPTGQLLLGSSRQFDSTSTEIDADMLAQMLDRALAYMPALADLNAIRCWTGLRAATPDGLPLLGPHPWRAGLWLAVGHEGLGVTTAPATGHLLAAHITGAPSQLSPMPYMPERFPLAP